MTEYGYYKTEYYAQTALSGPSAMHGCRVDFFKVMHACDGFIIGVEDFPSGNFIEKGG